MYINVILNFALSVSGIALSIQNRKLRQANQAWKELFDKS